MNRYVIGSLVGGLWTLAFFCFGMMFVQGCGPSEGPVSSLGSYESQRIQIIKEASAHRITTYIVTDKHTNTEYLVVHGWTVSMPMAIVKMGKVKKAGGI